MKTRKLSLEELERLSVEEFKSSQKTPIVIVLDDIRSALNVGSFFRTADALAIEKIYLCGITARPPHKEILKTAIGATESVEWAYVQDWKEAMNSHKDYILCSVEQTSNSILLDQVQNQISNKEGYVLIFGNEVKGVNEEAIEASDYCIEIPQFGTKHSFNVSVCGGIVLWEFWKMINKSKHES